MSTIIGFDWDGTLVESFTANPLPGVRERVKALPKDAKTFIATNQGGPAWRAVTGDAKYPTAAQVAENLISGLAALDWQPDLLLIAAHPGRDGQAWQQAAEDASLEIRDALLAQRRIALRYHAAYSQPRYRKPGRGMLFEAISFFGAYPEQMLFIGDLESDAAAARAAGARFRWAGEWLREGL